MASILTVGPSGQFNSIQAAIDAASAGDTIQVEAGTYAISSTIMIDKSITLLGAQAGVDPRTAAGSRSAGDGNESIIDGGGTLLNLIKITANNVTIDGFDVRNGTGDLITSSSTASISNPVIRYNFVHGSATDEGMQIRNAANPIAEYNNVYDTGGDGINFTSDNSTTLISTDGIVRFNEVHNTSLVAANANAAIYLDGARNTTVQGNLVYDITHNDGIKIGDKAGSSAAFTGGLVIDNIVHDTDQDGIAVYMSNVTVSGNAIYNSTSENGAIFVEFDVANIAIQGNSIHDNGVGSDSRTTYAIRIGKDGNPTNVTITDNTLAANEVHLFFKNGANNIQAVLEHVRRCSRCNWRQRHLAELCRRGRQCGAGRCDLALRGGGQ
jgi:hypothetical protein